MLLRPLLVALTTTLLVVSPATATDSPTAEGEGEPIRKDVRAEIPILAYAYTATGASRGNVGAEVSGLGVGGARQRAILGGGGAVWGSPIDRLTLIGDAQRNAIGDFAPSFAGVVRLLGTPTDGWSLGALGKFKIDGFGVGPKNEMETEVETGLLVSFARAGWHLDVNAIGGMGLGDDGEIDGEGRLRLGRDIGQYVRVGLDGQARFRLAGDRRLAGNRLWDFAGGPQMLFGSTHFFGALTAGPATMGVYNSVGWTGIASIGGDDAVKTLRALLGGALCIALPFAGCSTSNTIIHIAGDGGANDGATDDSATDGGMALDDGGNPVADSGPVPDAGPPWSGGPLTCTTPGVYTKNYGGCGTERWVVKTGGDSQAASITLTPTPTTITALTAMNGGVPVNNPPASSRIAPVENHLVFLRDVTIDLARLESDSDYHLGIHDGTFRTMIAEIPYPGGSGQCLDPGNPWACLISRARAATDVALAPSQAGSHPGVLATIVGVPFYDFPHGQNGEAPNGIELHPVLAICFGKGCTPM